MLGLDFGTTNSAIAVARPGEAPRLAVFDDGAPTFRSILHVDPEDADEGGLPPRVTAGASAIRTWVETGGRGRLIQSIKSHLASRLFTATDLFGRRYRLEDLIAIVLRDLGRAAEAQLGVDLAATPVVVGRPVRFAAARDADDEAFALGRLEAALRQAGFGPVTFELEPIAAAWGYRERLERDELVLIGDFGGGTSDFTLVRLGATATTILGVDGVARAGDAFDARLIRRVAAPGLGLGSLRRTAFGQELPVPGWLYDKVERWEQLSFLKSRETTELLRRLRVEAVEPEKIAALVHLVEDDLGFALHGAIEGAKQVLSRDDTARFRFEDGPDRAGAPSRTLRLRRLDRARADPDGRMRRRPAGAHRRRACRRRHRIPDRRLVLRARGATHLRRALRRAAPSRRRGADDGCDRARAARARRRVTTLP